MSHRCPEDTDAFFAQLFAYFAYGRGVEPPEGYVECRICGDFYKRDRLDGHVVAGEKAE